MSEQLNPYKEEPEEGRHVVLRYPNGWDGHGWLAVRDGHDVITIDGRVGWLMEVGDIVTVDGAERRIVGSRNRFEMDPPGGPVTKAYTDLRLHPLQQP
jgi:hypothetical protein